MIEKNIVRAVAAVRRRIDALSTRRRGARSTGDLREAGMATAEYAIATLAACGFAALLLTLMTSGEVRDLLFGIVRRALTVG